MSQEVEPTPYERVGGAAAVRGLVERFYDLMESDPEVAPLRAMHARDLGPMRDKLADFLTGWLGGPNLYFEREDSRCMGSVHRPYPIDNAIREQWLSCMHRALDESGIPPDLQSQMRNALGQMTEAMRNR